MMIASSFDAPESPSVFWVTRPHSLNRKFSVQLIRETAFECRLTLGQIDSLTSISLLTCWWVIREPLFIATLAFLRFNHQPSVNFCLISKYNKKNNNTLNWCKCRRPGVFWLLTTIMDRGRFSSSVLFRIVRIEKRWLISIFSFAVECLNWI